MARGSMSGESCGPEAARRDLVEGAKSICALVSAGKDVKTGTPAFTKFRQAVMQGRREALENGVTSIDSLLEVVEEKGVVLCFLFDFYAARKCPRQVEAVMGVLLQAESWRASLRQEPSLVSRLPPGLADLLQPLENGAALKADKNGAALKADVEPAAGAPSPPRGDGEPAGHVGEQPEPRKAEPKRSAGVTFDPLHSARRKGMLSADLTAAQQGQATQHRGSVGQARVPPLSMPRDLQDSSRSNGSAPGKALKPSGHAPQDQQEQAGWWDDEEDDWTSSDDENGHTNGDARKDLSNRDDDACCVLA